MRIKALGAAAVLLVSGAAQAGDSAHPTVVELFQSQGCSSCPPANANVMALSDRPDVLTLSLGVTYWDYLGWKDTFASPQYTDRQRDYARAFHRRDVFTPEVVVNGREDVVGTDRAELEALIKRSARTSEPDITLTPGAVTVGAGGAQAAQVWLVRYDPNIVQVPVTRGENSGVTLPHRNVVHELVKLGDWNGKEASYAIPSSPNKEWRAAFLLQQGPGGPIIAAAR
ncbi:MAG TPA: DUF1223 domain-containing protein [Rhizomicrobium sp.]|jgi:hypothetical protein|nr:DUF1223 domain-containing protein [Rhizomicrobium sp.]